MTDVTSITFNADGTITTVNGGSAPPPGSFYDLDKDGNTGW